MNRSRVFGRTEGDGKGEDFLMKKSLPGTGIRPLQRHVGSFLHMPYRQPFHLNPCFLSGPKTEKPGLIPPAEPDFPGCKEMRRNIIRFSLSVHKLNVDADGDIGQNNGAKFSAMGDVVMPTGRGENEGFSIPADLCSDGIRLHKTGK